MQRRIKGRYSYVVIGLLGAVLFILQYAGLPPMIGKCSAVLLIPFTVICGAFSSPVQGAVIGAICGVFMDIYGASSPAFNLMAMFFIGLASGIVFTYFFNRNAQAFAILNLAVSILYFFFKWICFYGVSGGFYFYFIRVGIFSALYTAVTAIPVYYLITLFLKLSDTLERR